MSRSESIPADSVKVDAFQIERLALCYDKPIVYVEHAVKFFGVTHLPKFRNPYDGLGEFFSALTAFYDETPSLTKQEFTAECDINNIMRRFAASGYDPSTLPLTSKSPRYGDFTSFPDSYHSALNYVKDTERNFLSLDADLRARFDNDPQKFLDFVLNPDNVEELYELGLAIRPSDPSDPRPTNSAVGAEGDEPPKAASSSKKPISKASGGDEGA